jgi:hypothetical protein
MARVEKRVTQKGHRKLKVFLGFIIILIIAGAGTGIGLYLKNKNTNKVEKTVVSMHKKVVSKPPVQSSDASIPNSWVSYSNEGGSFSLKYPSNWLLPTTSKLCSADTISRTLYLASSSANLYKCGSASPGEIEVSSVVGDQRTQYELNPEYFNSGVIKVVTLNGVAGTEESGIMIKTSTTLYPGYVLDARVTRYTFYTGNNTYIAQIVNIDNSATNDLANFNLMVTKSLEFHS